MNELFLQEKLTELGADLVGFSRIDKSPVKSSELLYAVTIAVKLPDAVLKTIEERPTIEYFHQYRTANALLDQITFKGARIIEKLGYKAFPIPASQSSADRKDEYAGLFSHKIGARLSGLGFIGKSALFISTEYGSKVRLATILTDMPVAPQRPLIENGCGDCEICKNACPGGAITGNSFNPELGRENLIDAKKCSQNMKSYNDIGRGAVCGICVKVCPYNKL